jgi:hypothetical protein
MSHYLAIEPKGTLRRSFEWVRDLSAVPQRYYRHTATPAVFIVSPTALKRTPQECPDCFELVKDSHNRGYWQVGWTAPLVFHYACSKAVGLWQHTQIGVYASKRGVSV